MSTETLLTTIINKIQESLILKKSFGQLLDISPKHLYFQKPLIQNFHTLKYGLLIKILNF